MGADFFAMTISLGLFIEVTAMAKEP